MKKLISIFLCVLLVFCFSASAVFADSDGILEWASEDQAEDVDSLGEAIVELARVAVKVWIFLGLVAVGIVALIVSSAKKKAAKKAAKAGVKAVSKVVGKSAKKTGVKTSESESLGASSGKNASGETSGEENDTYIATDSATGAQTLYIKDASGNWVSQDGSTILDTDKLADWQQSRVQDRKWQNKSNEALNNPTKFEDIDKQEVLENEKIKRESYEEKIAIKHGMDTSDMDAVYEKVSADKAREEVRGQKLQEHAEHVDTVLKVTENLKATADYSVSALGAVTGPAGTVVKDIYTAGTTLSEDIATAVVEGKDVAQAAAGAVTKSAIGVIQNHVSGVAGKASADIVGGAVSGGVDAYVGGENVEEGIVKGGAGGVVSAMFDAGGEMVGALKDDSALSELNKNLVSSASDTFGDFMKNTSSDAIDKSFDKTFKELNPEK